MKIGLIGNMNNNNFALLRYFRDLGADAHLLLYANDGKWLLNHFKPEADTWSIEKWSPFIHQTDIPNAPVAALGFPFSWILSYRSLIRAKMGLQDGWIHHVSTKQIRSAYDNYDVLIGSGISPATLSRVGMVLDIFYPYSTGVEFLKSPEFISRNAESGGVGRLVFNKIAKQQMMGIKAAKNVLSAEFGITHNILLDIGIKPHLLAIPIIYIEKELPEAPPTKDLSRVTAKVDGSEFTILHHSRLMWRKPAALSSQEWIKQSKNNDWLFHAFSALINQRKNLKARMIVVEYGPDVEATKKLAGELGISDLIDWLPVMGRRELLWLLSRVSVGVGEFYDLPRTIWGGTGWEVLASGKPLLQGMNFEEDEFDQVYGYPPPPMLPVRKKEDIMKHLLDMVGDPEKRIAIGHGAKEWFNRYNGIGLARQWLDLLMAQREVATRIATSIQGAHV